MDHAANAGAGPQRPKTDSTQPLADHYWLVTPDKAVVLASSTWESGSVGGGGESSAGVACDWSGRARVFLGWDVREYGVLDDGWRGRGLFDGQMRSGSVLNLIIFLGL